jgi:hypothetical protein
MTSIAAYAGGISHETSCYLWGAAMSAVAVTRLAARRRYRGFFYRDGSRAERLAEFSGAEWKQELALRGLTLHTIPDDPGYLAGKRGAITVLEIFEDET